MSRLRLCLLSSIGAAIGVSMLNVGTAAAQNQIIEDSNKQLGRQISDSIARRTSIRVTSDAVGTAVASGTTSDKNSSVWFNGTYNNLSTNPSFMFDGDNVTVDADLDLYQGTAGLDHRFDKFFAGFALSYTRAEFSASVTSPGIGNIDANEFSAIAGTSGVSATASANTVSASGGANNYSFNPYVGYMITPYLYPLAILGYTRTDVDDTSVSADTFSSDLSMNYADRIDRWIARGKVGWRHLRVSVDVPGVDSDAVNVDTFYAGATVGYQTGIFLPYFMAQYERLLNNTDAPTGTTGLSIDPNFLYLTGGVDVDVIPDLTLGVAGQVEAVNSLTDSYSAIVNLRFRF